jgi:anti-anti-sigma factor
VVFELVDRSVIESGELVMLEVQTKKLETIAILCLKGRVVTGELEILRNTVHSLSDMSAIILDLSGVTTVDAGGLGLLLELRSFTQANGICFELMNVNKWVRGVLEVVRLDTVFKITSAVEFFPSVARTHPATMGKLASCA